MKQKIAVPVDESGILHGHFGHCKFFAIFYVKTKEILKEEKIVPPPHEPGLLPKWLSENGVTDVLTGGMGKKARNLFSLYDIEVLVGAPVLEASEVVKGYLDKSLKFALNSCEH